MAEMSPLARILMGILQKGSWAAAVLIMVFGGILCYQRYVPGQGFAFRQGDFSFLGILAVMLAVAFYLVRAIKQEMRKPGD